MNVNWIKGEIDPPETGAYYVIREQKKNTYYSTDYIEIDTDYYDCKQREWAALGNDSLYKVVAWARMLMPNIPECLLGKVNRYFGVDLK